MQNRITAFALMTLSITCGAVFAAQLTPAQKIDRVATILKSLETRGFRPLAYIDSVGYPQHDLQVADGPAALKELMLRSPDPNSYSA
jgi:hypothetical protein